MKFITNLNPTKMRRTLLISMIIAFCLNIAVSGQTDPKQKGLDAITMDAIKGQLEFLASDWTEGRQTGERGMYLAGDYVASMFKVFGVAPGGDPMGFSGGGGRGWSDTGSTGQRSIFKTSRLSKQSRLESLPLLLKKGTGK